MAEVITRHGELSGICGHDGDNWEKILIDASKRLVVAVAAITGELEVVQDTPADLKVATHSYDGTTWRKNNLLFGYYDRWEENLDGLSVGTSYIKDSTPVPEGYIYVAQVIYARNNAAITPGIELIIRTGDGNEVILVTGQTVAQYIPILFNGQIVLKQADYVRIQLTTGGAGESIVAGGWGYKMKIDM